MLSVDRFLVTGVVKTIDFPSARLVFRSDSDLSSIDVPIRFLIKVHNASVEMFHSYTGKEVYIIGGEKRGYRGTLHDLCGDKCTVAVLGQHPISIASCDVTTQFGMRLNGMILNYHDMISFCETHKQSFLTPITRSATPPPEKIAPSRIDPGASDSSFSLVWSSWSDDQNLNPSASHDNPTN
ncbi:hypothetical protein BDR07DRAFT_1502640 [Suillus spraguei]|nr:hypothetical protein BDR07DRAFT_1502640 [Suillus spraguei]